MIRIRNPKSIADLTHKAAEHYSSAEQARRDRDELDAQIKPLEEQLRKLANERETRSREYADAYDQAVDMVGVVRQICADNGWAVPQDLPPIDGPREELPPPAGQVEAAARAATESTQGVAALRIAELDLTRGDRYECMNCHVAVYTERDTLLHVGTGRQECGPAIRPDDTIEDPPPPADASGAHPVLGKLGLKGGRS